MSKISVTKGGRPKKYKSAAERQRAYRRRREAEEVERDRQFHYRQRKLDPNRIINETVMGLRSAFEGIDLIPDCKDSLDRSRLPEWIASLNETRWNLSYFIRLLKKL